MNDKDSAAVLLSAIDAMHLTFREAGPLANPIEDAKAEGFMDALEWVRKQIDALASPGDAQREVAVTDRQIVTVVGQLNVEQVTERETAAFPHWNDAVIDRLRVGTYTLTAAIQPPAPKVEQEAKS